MYINISNIRMLFDLSQSRFLFYFFLPKRREFSPMTMRFDFLSLLLAYLYIVSNPANHTLSRSACNVRCTLRGVRDASGRAPAAAHRGGRRSEDAEPIVAFGGTTETRPHHETGGARGRPGIAQHQNTARPGCKRPR